MDRDMRYFLIFLAIATSSLVVTIYLAVAGLVWGAVAWFIPLLLAICGLVKVGRHL